MIAWFKTAVGGAVGLVLAALLLFGAVKGCMILQDRNKVDATDWKKKYNDLKHIDDSLATVTVRDSIEYKDQVVPVYIKGRDNPANSPEVKKAYAACDIVLSACERVQADLRAQIVTKNDRITKLENPPAPPRLGAYGRAAYDFVGLRPVFGVGATARLIGPLSAFSEAQYAVPSMLRPSHKGDSRLLLGGEIRF